MSKTGTPGEVALNAGLGPGAEARRLAAAISPLRRPCAPDHLTAGAAAHMLEAQADEIERLRDALLHCARQAEALKRECGMDPESAQAVRNAQYQAVSTAAHIALGTIRGPNAALSGPHR